MNIPSYKQLGVGFYSVVTIVVFTPHVPVFFSGIILEILT